jgi:hypothetical protein
MTSDGSFFVAWMPRTLARDEQMTFIHYYGVGERDVDAPMLDGAYYDDQLDAWLLMDVWWGSGPGELQGQFWTPGYNCPIAGLNFDERAPWDLEGALIRVIGTQFDMRWSHKYGPNFAQGDFALNVDECTAELRLGFNPTGVTPQRPPVQFSDAPGAEAETNPGGWADLVGPP